MAPPTAPTSTTIVSEALAKAGYSSPASALTTRGNLWLEEIKSDVWSLQKRLKSLQTMSVAIMTKGKSRYSNPTDYASDLSLKLMDGGNTGTAQTGASTSITLAASQSFGQNYIIGKEIVITGGTGVGSISQVTAYNDSTKVATMTPAFNTAPTSGSTYMIVDVEYPLDIDVVWRFDESNHPTSLSRPCSFYPLGDSDYGEFVLNAAPDKSYPVKMRYYANLMTLDLAGTLIATLYQKWRNVWLAGVKWKALDDADDDRSAKAKVEYEAERTKMIMDELYGERISTLSATVAE